MPIKIDIEPIQSLIAQPESYLQVSENPGFSLYWRQQGRNPEQVATELASTGGDRVAVLKQPGPSKKTVLDGLNRISGVSLEQQVLRHLPEGSFVQTQVVFLPGADAPLVDQGTTVAVNAFALEQRGTKLFIGDFPLLSLLANRVHQLCTKALVPVVPPSTSAVAVKSLLHSFLLQGSATLFFTMPVSGPVYNLWQQAGKSRDSAIEKLRRYLQADDGDSPLALLRQMEDDFSLKGKAALGAKYPLATWMCQVIESAHNRSHLVQLFQQPSNFLATYEQARKKFGLPEKYSLGGL